MKTLPSPFDISKELPDSLGFVWLEEAEVDGHELKPGEQDLITDHFTSKRLVEFKMGRAAAGQLLEEIGIVSPQGILKGSEGEPIWPEGCVGSISHSAGIAIAAAARTENFSGIGVDLELWNPSRDYKFLSKALNPDEQEWVGCDHKKGLQIFSAKEALYKLIFSGFGLKPTFGSVSFMTELDGKLTAQWNVLGKTEEELQKLLPSPSCQSYVCKDSSDKDYLVNVCWLDANLET